MAFEKILYIVRALPGSGKTTFALSLGFPYFEADDYFYRDGEYQFDITKLSEAHQDCRQRLELSMISGCNKLIVSNTSTTEKEIEPYIRLASNYNYKVISLIVENRHGGKSVHNVPEDKLEQMRERFSIRL